MKIAVISDLHFEKVESNSSIGIDVMLCKAVEFINDTIQPDVALLLGDLLEDGDQSDATDLMKHLKVIIDRIKSPIIVIPGNHDCAPDDFYSVFEVSPELCDIGGVRFLTFVDPEEPEYNASRSAEDIERFKHARMNFDGPIVSLQHVPIFIPGDSQCPFNYINADEIIREMCENDIVLSISGHYHAGMELPDTGGIYSLASPAFCDEPFRFLEVELCGREIRVTTHALAGLEL